MKSELKFGERKSESAAPVLLLKNNGIQSDTRETAGFLDLSGPLHRSSSMQKKWIADVQMSIFQIMSSTSLLIINIRKQQS